jgi:hypothetical protein
MASDQAPDRDSGPTRSARPPVTDARGRLEERLDRASRAAERLFADGAERKAAGDRPGGHRRAGDGPGRPPPAGWQQPAPERDPISPLLADSELLLGVYGALRDRIPPDLQQRLAEAIREVLLALRALIDWYLERTEQTRSDAAAVQDIPIQ